MNKSVKTRRLYQEVAARLVQLIEERAYAVGSRLPSERELATMFGVSRPTMREAVIALELGGRVEVRTGSGVYVLKPADDKQSIFDMDVGQFELTEARALFESEAAALAATLITDEEIAALETAIEAMQKENENHISGETADHDFHMIIARATRNSAIASVIDDLWNARDESYLARNMYEIGRNSGIIPAVDDHRVILEALRARDPQAARLAMRSHLMNVIEEILLATEAEAVEEAKRKVGVNRKRYLMAKNIG